MALKHSGGSQVSKTQDIMFLDKGMFKEEEYMGLSMLTVSQAAGFLGVGKKIVYQLIEFDEICAVRVRGAILIERESLEAFRTSGKLT